MTTIDVMKQALEALGGLSYADKEGRGVVMPERWMVTRAKDAITALRAEIERLEKVEPVAWCDTDEDGEIAWDKDSCFSDDPAWFDNPMPLYAHPAPAIPDFPAVCPHCLCAVTGLPEGWQLVPCEPTEKMIVAWLENCEQGTFQQPYKTMLAAAPKQGETK